MEDILEEILQDEIVDETDVFVQVEKLNRVNRRTFDYGRLRLLDNRLVDEHLSDAEVSAIAAHLKSNHPQFTQKNSNGELMTEEQIRTLIAQCPVLELDPKIDNEALYTRSIAASHCTVLLCGKIRIIAGREGFESEAGAWSVLAADSLITPEGTYLPDFTATAAGTEKLRCVHISRVEFQRVLYPVHLPIPTSSDVVTPE